MKRILFSLTTLLVALSPGLPSADEVPSGDSVTFTQREAESSEAAEKRNDSASPFFAGWQTQEVPAGEFLDDGSSYTSVSGFNFGYRSDPSGPFQAIHSNVSVTEYQTLVNAGVSAVLFENSAMVISGRALGGFAFAHDELDDSWNTSFDLYGAGKLGPSGRNLIKFGAFVDNQDDFGKWGPAMGLLLGADRAHPITIDAAYGMGYGDPYTIGQSVYSVADDDFQIQAGIALSPSLEVGVSGQYVKWGGVFSEEEDWKTGGFLRYHAPKGYSVSLGAAGGEHGTTGFLHFTIRPKTSPGLLAGGGSKSVAKSPVYERGFSGSHDFARTWMTAPIQRQESLQIRQETVPTEAPMGLLTCLATDNLNSPGTVLQGVDAIHQVTYTNTGTLDQVVTINSIENFNGTIAAVGTSATLAPGQQLTAQGPQTTIGPPPFNQSVVITVNGQQFNLTCSFPANHPFRVALPPVVVGP